MQAGSHRPPSFLPRGTVRKRLSQEGMQLSERQRTLRTPGVGAAALQQTIQAAQSTNYQTDAQLLFWFYIYVVFRCTDVW